MSTSPSSQLLQFTNRTVPAIYVPTGGPVSPDHVPMHRASIPVYDRIGPLPLTCALVDAGVEIVSVGSATAIIAAAGLAVTPVEEVTGFPEYLEGRVKTLHLAVHAGILVDRCRPDHLGQLAILGVVLVNLVVVNPYPFTDIIAFGVPSDARVEQIDIGGSTVVRIVAKNYPAAAMVTSSDRYKDVAAVTREDGFTLSGRRYLAVRAFARTTAYGAAVSTQTAARIEADAVSHAMNSADATEVEAGEPAASPTCVGVGYERLASLRHGENPHQWAAAYRIIETSGGVADARQLHGKAMSYNNYISTGAVVYAVYDHGPAAVVAVVKHANPCDIVVSVAGDIAEAHRKVRVCSPVSTYGGAIATNAVVTAEMARQIKPVFTEIVAAPAFDDKVVEIPSTKKSLRLLLAEALQREGYEIKQVSRSAVTQECGVLDAIGDDSSTWTLAVDPVAGDAFLVDLASAQRSVRTVCSDTVLLVHDGVAVGVGMGQVDRADSCKLTAERINTLGTRSAGDVALDSSQQEKGTVGGVDITDVPIGAVVPQCARGAVATPDTFFPFADDPQAPIDTGVHTVAQPSGPIRDQEVIDAVQVTGITIYLTGTRHFFH